MLLQHSGHVGFVSSLGNTETKLLKMNASGSVCVYINVTTLYIQAPLASSYTSAIRRTIATLKHYARFQAAGTFIFKSHGNRLQ
jgi:hypothetical protein